ncbi:DUF5068 domain-containing protein [Heyndrickxia sp. FSL W8-0496]|uniref:DUF5068 domain-containing protein n=1 Tax=Heyndrickxia sp. FSL W8-0496 TaxID=2954702 RepID=UPI0030F7A67A
MGKKVILTLAIISSMLLFAACGSSEKASKEKETKPKTTEIKSDIQKKEKESVDKEEESKDSGEILNPAIAKETEGNVEVVYSNNQPNFSHEMDGFKVNVEEYQIVKVTDMNPDVTIPFKDQTDGYVVTAKVTLENNTGKPMYYTNFHRIQLTDQYDYVSSNWKSFVSEDQQINTIKKEKDEVSLFAAGEKVTGLLNFLFTNEQFETMKTVKPKYIIEGGVADNDQFKGSFRGDSPAYDFIYSGEQKKAIATQPKFYQDRLTMDNMADKKMIFEKTGIDKTLRLGDVKVTLEGVQYTDITPTAASKERFRNFNESGIVALTVKLNIDNQSNQPVSIWNIGSKLRIDKNRATVFSQGMVEPSNPKEIKAGEKGEKLHVFLFNKDEFGIFKKFDLEFGPFYGEDGKGLFKDKTVTFTLPR